MTNGQRTLKWCREEGFYPWRVETFNSFSGKKTDLYHIIDYIAITPKRIVGVQSCGSDFADHIAKLIFYERENTIKWLEMQERELVLIGWRRVKLKRGGKAIRWKPRIVWFYYKERKLYFKEMEYKE